MADDKNQKITVKASVTETKINTDVADSPSEVTSESTSTSQAAPATESETAAVPQADPTDASAAEAPKPGDENKDPNKKDQGEKEEEENPELEEDKLKEDPEADKIKDKTDSSETPGEEVHEPGEARPNEDLTENKLDEPPGQKPTNGSKGLQEGGEQATKTAAEDTAKIAADGAKVAQVAEGAEVAAEGVAVAGETIAVGWIVILVLIAICLIVIVIFGIIACNAQEGGFGKSNPLPAGKDYANSKAILSDAATPAVNSTGNPVNGHNKIELTSTDAKFISDGQIDKRLADALEYLSKLHLSLGISNIINGFSDKKAVNPESGADKSIIENSAHNQGTAADITTIDFVYKVDEEKQECQQMLSAACGPFASACKTIAAQIKLGDLVYYSDKAEQANTTTTGSTGTPGFNLDDNLSQAKIAAQKIKLDAAAEATKQGKIQLDSLTARLQQTKTTLINRKNQGTLTPEQQALIQAQIDRTNAIIAQTKTTIASIESYQQNITQLSQKMADLNQKLTTLKNTLTQAKKMSSTVTSIIGNNTSSKDSASSSATNINNNIDKMLASVNKAALGLANMSTQVSTFTTNLQEQTTKFNGQVAAYEAIVNKTVTDNNAYINSLNQQSGAVTTLDGATVLSSVQTSMPNLDEFSKMIEQIIESIANNAIDQMSDQLEGQLKTAVEGQLSKAMGNYGLSFSKGNELLRMPCVGFILPNADSVTGGALGGALGGGFDIGKLGGLKTLINKNVPGGTDITSLIPDNSTQSSAIVDKFLSNEKILEQKANLDQVQTTIDQNKVKLKAAQDKMASNLAILKTKKEQASLKPEDRVKIQDQINKVQDAINKGNDEVNKVDAFRQKLTPITQNVSSILNQIQQIQSLVSPNGIGQVGEVLGQASSTMNSVSKVAGNVDLIINQVRTASGTIQNLTTDKVNDVAALEGAINKNSADIDGYLKEIDQYSSKLSAAQNMNVLDTVVNSSPNIQDLSTTFTKIVADSKNFNIASMEKQINDVVNGQLTDTMSKIGLGSITDNVVLNVAVIPNTKYKDNPYAQAVPIKVKWQDPKPSITPPVEGTDDCMYYEPMGGPLICMTVLRPEAQRKVHQVIQELLDFPTVMKDQYYYKVNQLITFNKDRDVTPFAKILDDLYGASRQPNIGLFALPQMWPKIHIGY